MIDMNQRQRDHQKRIETYKETERYFVGVKEKIKGHYGTIESMDDSDPEEILKICQVQAMILELYGELHSISIEGWKYAESLKKEAYALTVVSDRPPGMTVEQHKQIATLDSQEWRWKMAEWEGLTRRWANAKDSVQEQINILKWKAKWELAHRNVGGVANGGA